MTDGATARGGEPEDGRGGGRRVERRISLPGVPGEAVVAIGLPAPSATYAELAAEVARVAAGTASDLVVAASVGRGRAPSCAAGCGACCRQLVPVSIPEALALDALVGAMEPERRRAVEARFDEAVARLEAAGSIGTLERLDDPGLDDEAHFDLARRYFALSIACPFLEDESCSIHPDRPSACREYWVASPAAGCRDPFREGPDGRLVVDRIRVRPRVEQALASVFAALEGGEPRVLPLALALRFARSRPDLAPARRDSEKLLAAFELYLELTTDPPGSREHPGRDGSEVL